MTKVNDLRGQRQPLTRLIQNILTNNSIHINHGTSISMEIIHTNDVLQGDALSPLSSIGTTAVQKENRCEYVFI
jgi:hypothetical protein